MCTIVTKIMTQRPKFQNVDTLTTLQRNRKAKKCRMIKKLRKNSWDSFIEI